MGTALKKSRWLLCVSYLLVITAGCASPVYKADPKLMIRTNQITRPGLFFSDVKIYEVSAGGVVELRDDWCTTGKENLQRALVDGLMRKKYNVKPVFVDEELEGEIKEMRALYASVNRSIQLHIYGPQFFPEKASNSDYSIGCLEGIVQKLGVDSLVLVCAFGQVTSVSRRVSISLALADSSGSILWYQMKGSDGGYDLRDSESTKEFLDGILVSFPEVGG